MLGLLAVSLDTECATPAYPRVLGPQDSATSFTITQAGAVKFVTCALGSAMVFATSTPIPDLQFQLDLGVTQIDFSLKDIVFADMTYQDVGLEFAEQNYCTGSLSGCTAKLDFQWQFQQSSWPYLFDHGSGSLLLQNAAMKVVVGTSCNYDTCPGHLTVDAQRADITFDSVQIQLEGGSSWIYQSMIDIVLSAVQDSLAEVISGVMVQAFQLLMEDSMFAESYAVDYLSLPDVSKDERFVAPWGVGMGYMSVFFSGYTYYKDNLADEFVEPGMLTKVTPNYNNDDLAFLIQKAALQNTFYIMHKYHDAYSGEAYRAVEMPALEFSHVAAVLQMEVEARGASFDIRLKAVPRCKTISYVVDKMNQNTTLVLFDYEVYSAQQLAGETADAHEVAEEVASHMNAVKEETAFQINKTPFMDMDTFKVLLDVSQDVIRITGNNPPECPSL